MSKRKRARLCRGKKTIDPDKACCIIGSMLMDLVGAVNETEDEYAREALWRRKEALEMALAALENAIR